MADALKETLFSSQFIDDLATNIQHHLPSFAIHRFHQMVLNDDWPGLELKQRMRHITQVLHTILEMPFESAVRLLMKVAPDNADHPFGNMIFPDYVELYGLDDLETSLEALELFTQFGSSEFGIRPFLIRYPEATLTRMYGWTQHPNMHVRRLASEGCRPRLPWAMALPALKQDPSPILPILENLKADSEDYVRRSVANNLNDISKDHPDLVLDIGHNWLGDNGDTDRVVKHALRTLLKAGNTRALTLFGYGEPTMIAIQALKAPSRISIGEELPFQFELINRSQKPQKLRLEYAVDYVKKRGTLSRKVFKITENTYEPGRHVINRRQWFKDFSTRVHYPGKHQITIIVNGEEKTCVDFDLISSIE